MNAPGIRQADEHEKAGSLYGQDLLNFVPDHHLHRGSAHAAACYVLTHGQRFPMEQAVRSLGFFDRAAFEALASHPDLPIGGPPSEVALEMYVNSLGRLHIRPAGAHRPIYDPEDRTSEVGLVAISPEIGRDINERLRAALDEEGRQMARVRRAVDALQAEGTLPQVLEQVIDHIEHVESVCFYVGDRFFALIDRFVNLVESRKGQQGFLTRLREVPYDHWDDDEVLVVAALHALFISGRSVRFEEFNGIALTATALWSTLERLLAMYRSVGCDCDLPEDADLFALARKVGGQLAKGIGKDWLRYRWIYGLTFQKTERVLPSTASSEDPAAHLAEFADRYSELVGRPPAPTLGEPEMFLDLARACLQRDLAAVDCDRGSPAVTSWIEYLMEAIVASAVMATDADYGMSSSLKDVSRLVETDRERLIAYVHTLKPANFFTCFVSRGFSSLDKETADTIASSVQMRMMFNRWHFFPGNFDRDLIARSRHWYYPPVIPDIAIHSDVHRAAHSRAQVKFSVRAPGPDMSRPPLVIASQPYRGFYDVRVVRMNGHEFSTEDMLRTRRRTLWMENLYAVVADHLQANPGRGLPIRGFQPGSYLDIAAPGRDVPDGDAVHERHVA